MESISLEALASFGVGHAHDEAAGTGCTVVVAPHGAICGVDVRGGGQPRARQTCSSLKTWSNPCMPSCFPEAVRLA